MLDDAGLTLLPGPVLLSRSLRTAVLSLLPRSSRLSRCVAVSRSERRRRRRWTADAPSPFCLPRPSCRRTWPLISQRARRRVSRGVIGRQGPCLLEQRGLSARHPPLVGRGLRQDRASADEGPTRRTLLLWCSRFPRPHWREGCRPRGWLLAVVAGSLARLLSWMFSVCSTLMSFSSFRVLRIRPGPGRRPCPQAVSPQLSRSSLRALALLSALLSSLLPHPGARVHLARVLGGSSW